MAVKRGNQTRESCRHLLTIYISLLKRHNQNRFAQTASIGVGGAFAPCAEDIASAHPRRCTCDGREDLCGVANSAHDPCTPLMAHPLENCIRVSRTAKEGLELL